MCVCESVCVSVHESSYNIIVEALCCYNKRYEY